MSFIANAIFSLSIAIGGLIGLIRARKTDHDFLPFLILLWLGCLNEILSIVIISRGISNVVLYNTFTLVESLLICWQFRKWGLFNDRVAWYFFLQCLVVGTWIYMHFIRSNIHVFNSGFIMGHSVLAVALSIRILNRLSLSFTKDIMTNPIFLICIGIFIYFTYAILVEAFWVYGLNHSRAFRVRIYAILTYINLFTNILFAFAAAWIPLKRQYLLQS
jgi:hypothetical protein